MGRKRGLRDDGRFRVCGGVMAIGQLSYQVEDGLISQDIPADCLSRSAAGDSVAVICMSGRLSLPRQRYTTPARLSCLSRLQSRHIFPGRQPHITPAHHRPTLAPTQRLLHTAHPTMATIAQINVPATGKKIAVSTGLFINNQFVPSVDSKETIEYARTFPRAPSVSDQWAAAASTRRRKRSFAPS